MESLGADAVKVHDKVVFDSDGIGFNSLKMISEPIYRHVKCVNSVTCYGSFVCWQYIVVGT